ncbi:helix-turn-helix transcriptional regulator, partial [Streptomyces sp. G44]|uniref:helix-turn-helix transcriptional regulator n=1 Tax=Streptomyces sp. G44 TaxID=2807632 RepID=UPI001EF9B6FF
MPQSPATSLPSPKERRRLREAKSLSQAALAAKLGVSRETVRSWERGRTNPRGHTHEAYARFLTAAAEEQSEKAGQPGTAPARTTSPRAASPKAPSPQVASPKAPSPQATSPQATSPGPRPAASPARRGPRTQPADGARSTTRPEPPAKR